MLLLTAQTALLSVPLFWMAALVFQSLFMTALRKMKWGRIEKRMSERAACRVDRLVRFEFGCTYTCSPGTHDCGVKRYLGAKVFRALLPAA
jgi:hypothetical protein